MREIISNNSALLFSCCKVFVPRFIGDRRIQVKDFGLIQIDRIAEMRKWANNFKTVEDERIKLAIIAANNHYARFGPGTVNVFRYMLGLPEAQWQDREEKQDQEQQRQYPAHYFNVRFLIYSVKVMNDFNILIYSVKVLTFT